MLSSLINMKNGKFLKVIKFVGPILIVLQIAVLFTDFYSNFFENNLDWAVLIMLIMSLPALIEAVLYLKNVTDEEKDEYVYSSSFVFVLGNITLFIFWLILLSNRLRK